MSLSLFFHPLSLLVLATRSLTQQTYPQTHTHISTTIQSPPNCPPIFPHHLSSSHPSPHLMNFVKERSDPNKSPHHPASSQPPPDPSLQCREESRFGNSNKQYCIKCSPLTSRERTKGYVQLDSHMYISTKCTINASSTCTPTIDCQKRYTKVWQNQKGINQKGIRLPTSDDTCKPPEDSGTGLHQQESKHLVHCVAPVR